MPNQNLRYSLFLFTAAVVVASLGQSVAAPVRETPVNAAAPPVNAAAPPVITSHNAYDYFVAAGEAARETNKDAEVERASEQAPRDYPHVYTLAEKNAILYAIARPLSLVRQGFHYPFTPPPPSKDPFDAGGFPTYAGFRDLARLLRFESQVRAERGDWAGAMDSNLDAVQLGQMAAHGGGVIPRLVADAVIAIGRADAWDRVPHLTRRKRNTLPPVLEILRGSASR